MLASAFGFGRSERVAASLETSPVASVALWRAILWFGPCGASSCPGRRPSDAPRAASVKDARSSARARRTCPGRARARRHDAGERGGAASLPFRPTGSRLNPSASDRCSVAPCSPLSRPSPSGQPCREHGGTMIRNGAQERRAILTDKIQHHLRVFACRHVLDGERPVLLVSRDDTWSFLCGGQHEQSTKDFKAVCMGCLLEQDRSLLELLDLEPHWEAERQNADAPWVRSKY
jgi:hypothetical protein